MPKGVAAIYIPQPAKAARAKAETCMELQVKMSLSPAIISTSATKKITGHTIMKLVIMRKELYESRIVDDIMAGSSINRQSKNDSGAA
jgi:hypothetical protein